ncbi:MAG: hypothetical protein R3350_01110 [Saprospiraceae bacterium]|nr:hypothetical protein [Saprospiraceae bacterium]
MTKRRSSLRVLLLQMRMDRNMLSAERQGFLKFSGLEDHQLESLDLFRQPEFSPELIHAYDAVFIGGISDDPSQSLQLPPAQFPFINNLKAMIRLILECKKPAFLSCGGFMIASRLMGARVVIDPEMQEMGIYDIKLTKEGKADPIFRGFPPSFKAVSGHQKSTLEAPAGCSRLAFSDRCPVQAFRHNSFLFYAFQFHPEIETRALKSRVEAYREKYFDSREAYEAFINLMDDTTLANTLLSRFVELMVGEAP